jgi:formyltetrahydrofolate hydrolase
MANDHILTLSCPDKPGIIHAVTSIFANAKLNILDLQQFSDRSSEKFFMRVHFGPAESTESLVPTFNDLADDIKMTYDLRPVAQKPKVLIMVSKIGHCLNDLLFRQKTGQLAIDVPVIVSNHQDFEPLAKSYDIKFEHLPVNKDTKAEQESQILNLVKEHNIELIVLARYMQVLSPTLCEAMSGKIIVSAMSLEYPLLVREQNSVVLWVNYSYHGVVCNLSFRERKSSFPTRRSQIAAQFATSTSSCANFLARHDPTDTIQNIHHSFLPSFKGAKPYHQAFDRGVKIIGATAHVSCSSPLYIDLLPMNPSHRPSHPQHLPCLALPLNTPPVLPICSAARLPSVLNLQSPTFLLSKPSNHLPTPCFHSHTYHAFPLPPP